jgi:hypothetical protein
MEKRILFDFYKAMPSGSSAMFRAFSDGSCVPVPPNTGEEGKQAPMFIAKKNREPFANLAEVLPFYTRMAMAARFATQDKNRPMAEVIFQLPESEGVMIFIKSDSVGYVSETAAEFARSLETKAETHKVEALHRVVDERDAGAGIGSSASPKTNASATGGITSPPLQPGGSQADDGAPAEQRPSKGALALGVAILSLMGIFGIGFGLYTGICAQSLAGDWRVTVASGLLSLCTGCVMPILALAPMYFMLRALFPKSPLFRASDRATNHWFERLKMVLGPLWTICNFTISAVVGFAMSHDQLWLGWIVGCATSSVLACLYSIGLFLLSIIFWIADRRVSVGKEFKSVVSALCWSALFTGATHWVFTQVAPIL